MSGKPTTGGQQGAPSPAVWSAAALRDRLGTPIAVTPWIDVSQERIDQFARATDDFQWIHVDATRAAASPFGTTIGHGFLTLSLLTPLLRDTIRIEGTETAINYGLNRVRFVTPVPSGSRVRARVTPLTVDDVPGGIQVTWDLRVELEPIGERPFGKPACAAEWVVRYLS